MKKIFLALIAVLVVIPLTACGVDLDKYAFVIGSELTGYVAEGTISGDEFKVVGIQKYIDDAVEEIKKKDDFDPKVNVKVEKTDKTAYVYNSLKKLNDDKIQIYKLIITYKDKDGNEKNLDLGLSGLAGLIKLSDVKKFKTVVVY